MHDFVIPKVGMGITEVGIIEWRVGIGDKVKKQDPIVEIETEKAVVVLESDISGSVKEILYQNEDLVDVGSVICRIEED